MKKQLNIFITVLILINMINFYCNKAVSSKSSNKSFNKENTNKEYLNEQITNFISKEK